MDHPMKFYMLFRYVFLIASFLVGAASSTWAQESTKWYKLDGSPYESALSGGFQAPQFSEFDLDQDGIDELITFDRYSGIIQIWQWDGVGANYTLNPNINVEWPIVHSWMLVRDFNNDGIPDIFTQGLHGIAVFEGKQVGNKIVFEPLSGSSFIDDSLIFHNRSGGTTNIYHAVTDIPIIEDIDGDGDLDILTFEISGTYLYFYENRADETGQLLDYVLQHNCWGYFAENLFSEEINLSESDSGCPPPFTVRHAGSTSCFVDYDHDGVMDLLLGDVGSEYIKVLLNSGSNPTGFIEDIIHEFPHKGPIADLPYFPAAYRIDADKDSVPDVIIAGNEFPMSDSQGVWWYRGTGNAENPFTLETRHWLTSGHIDLGHYSSPLFFDVNGDGVSDLLVGYQKTVHSEVPVNRIAYFEALDHETFQLRDLDFESLSTVMTQGYRPYLTSGDVNGDGKMDLFIGMSDGTNYVIYNGSFPGVPFSVDRTEKNWAGLRMMSGASPVLFDFDGDGDLDVITGMDNGTIGLYVNTGNATQAEFESNLNIAPNINRVGGVRTVGPNALLGRSAPRIVVHESDTVLIAGSHQGDLYAYRFERQKIDAMFDAMESDIWPQWVGGNGRLAVSRQNNHTYRLIVGNIAGGLTEHSISWVSTSTDDRATIPLHVFPNPVTVGQDVKIHSATNRSIERIEVIHSSGIRYKSVAGSKLDHFSTESWVPGLYFLQIWFRDGGQAIQQLILL